MIQDLWGNHPSHRKSEAPPFAHWKLPKSSRIICSAWCFLKLLDTWKSRTWRNAHWQPPYLGQMVLHDIADDAVLVEIAAPPLSSKVFLKGNLRASDRNLNLQRWVRGWKCDWGNSLVMNNYTNIFFQSWAFGWVWASALLGKDTLTDTLVWWMGVQTDAINFDGHMDKCTAVNGCMDKCTAVSGRMDKCTAVSGHIDKYTDANGHGHVRWGVHIKACCECS